MVCIRVNVDSKDGTLVMGRHADCVLDSDAKNTTFVSQAIAPNSRVALQSPDGGDSPKGHLPILTSLGYLYRYCLFAESLNSTHLPPV